MENIRKRLDSESAYDFEIDEDEENVLQSSLESSLENVNVVNGQGLSNRNNNQNGNVSLVSSLLLNAKLLINKFQRFTPNHSLTSDESGIDLNLPFEDQATQLATMLVTVMKKFPTFRITKNVHIPHPERNHTST